MWTQKILLLAVGGAAGTLARFGLTDLVHRVNGQPTPLGTILVNALGCLIFGFIWAATEQKIAPGPIASLALLAGFCGAFTTFSTYGFEVHYLARHSGLTSTAAYILAQNVIGIALLFFGVWLGRVCIGAGG